MKIYSYFLIFILSSNISCSQSIEDINSLVKYSYCVLGSNFNDTTKTLSTTQGTGFFINNGPNKYFFTAKHVLIGCGYYGNKVDTGIDDVTVDYNDKNGLVIKKPWHIAIKQIRINTNCLPTYLSPDTISIQKIDTNHIYDINDILNNGTPKKMGQIVVFGFPLNNNIHKGTFTLKPASKIITTNYKIENYSYVRGMDNKVYVDSINLTVSAKDFVISEELKGFSGSPVFVKDEQKKRWCFLGLLTAINVELNQLIIIKSDHILNWAKSQH